MLSLILQLMSDSLPALACAVCGNLGDDPAAGAILAGTGLLSVAPILTIGGGIYYVYRKTKIDRGGADAPTDSASGAAPQESVLPAAD
ncbi:MAG: hypothetical protein RL011_884 [Pseudomonadota bacterium]|jgi:hypothetical protein